MRGGALDERQTGRWYRELQRDAALTMAVRGELSGMGVLDWREGWQAAAAAAMAAMMVLYVARCC